ncbi:MAG: TIGR02757 family protein [Bacteroidales bacterium]|nr:TIGR02757 family protein [Bacteroidales bacterium]MDD4178340.1 TIGR02757 family protein [Bacteroidales bacterium]MDD4742838.1 TIGR02757 family protein [Bacteroidales bacterium]NCU36652.1 TIGR02757 family protein [Candidatus Falkowbacteria bacterium]
MTNLKIFLDQKAAQYNSCAFIETDPVSVPHLFSRKEDIEIAGFFAATLAWGQRKVAVSNARRLMQMMEMAPHDFVLNFTDNDLKPFRQFVHRTFNGTDCEYFLWALKNIYQNHVDLENVFCGGQEDVTDVATALVNFRNTFFALDHPPRTEKHVANVLKNATAKRLNMFLRWMVRRDDNGVDFGLWKRFSPAQLICPLDVHSGRVARKLGLLPPGADNFAAALGLTERLRVFDADDPVRYDYALFGLGIFEGF